MTDSEFAQILALSHERSGIEFKGPGSASDRGIFAQFVKAVLGMANRRDGGTVIIGVDDSQGNLTPIGLNEQALATWKYDDVADRIAEYADPGIAFDLEVREYNGDKYVVVQVEEFTDIPVLCKKGYPSVCLLYTSPSPRDGLLSRMPSSA